MTVTATARAEDVAASERRGQVYVALAAIAWSTAGVLQRWLALDLPTQVAGRALFAALALLAYIAVAERGRVVQACRSVGVAGLGLAACLALASGGFLAALEQTTVARVLFILALAPVLAALLARVLLGEAVGRRTAVALAIAFGGVAVMVGAPGGADPLGDGLAAVTALGFAGAMVIARHRRDVSMAPATCLSQLILLVVFLPLASLDAIGAGEVVGLGAMGIGQIGLGLVLFTIGARLIPAAQVGLITLLEIVLGPIWVWLALGEDPDAPTLIGGAIVLAAIVYQTRGAPQPAPAPH